MFFKKCERKKHSVCVILTIGALAAIGACGVVHHSKQFVKDIGAKAKCLIRKTKNEMSMAGSEG